MTNIRKAKRQ